MTYDLDAFDTELFEEARSIMKARFPDMIEGYLEDARMYIDKIKEGFEASDKNMIAQYAHPLKSSSAGIGIASVSAIAKDMEYGAKDAIENGSDVESLKELLEPIEEAFRRAGPRLEEAMKDTAA